jgi:filamentous hemagglutinin family protein
MKTRRAPLPRRLQPSTLALAAAALWASAPATLWAQAAGTRVGPIPRAAAVPAGPALPVLSTDAARVAGNSGQFAVTQPNANQLLITQQSQRAIVNWDSFNVGAGRTVQFEQPGATSSTLNRIHDANPSVVQGRIQANGEVLLENANGLIFGATARVDTARFVATALRTADAAFQRGLRGTVDGSVVFSALSESERQGFVSFERGAEVKVAAGGDVLVFAPRVVNEGRIETPDGQTVLGAGRDVYLTASADPAQRGVLVRIQPFGGNDPELNTVTQAAAGTYRTRGGETVADAGAGTVERINAIVAERGSINLVALAIRQNGVLSATTAVKGRNGVVRLQAQAAVDPGVPDGSVLRPAGESRLDLPTVTALGTVTLGPQSRIEIAPDTQPEPQRDPNEPPRTTPAAQLDSDNFLRSQVRIEGRDVVLEGGSVVRAPGGRIEVLSTAGAPGSSLAVQGSGITPDPSGSDNGRVVVQAGAVLDAAGLRDVPLAMERHQGRLSLFQNELADAPLQRDGPLYRQELWFDLRNRPAVANVAGAYATIQRTPAELLASGGTIALRADGAVAVDQGAKLDVSGGSLSYAAGTIQRSLVRDGNAWITADRARADVRYEEFGNSSDRRNAGTAIWQTDAYNAYTEPRDAGTLEVVARRSWLGGTLAGSTVAVSPEVLRLGNPFAATSAAAQALAGRLVLGRGESNPVIELRVQSAAPTGRPEALFAAPLEGSIDTELAAPQQLSADALAAGGFGRLDLRALERLQWTAGTGLDLGVAGVARLQAVDLGVDGGLRAPAGRIELVAEPLAGRSARIALGRAARLDVAGQWLGADTRPAVAALDGGRIELRSGGALESDPGAWLDVSGGAQRLGTGVTGGRAGNLVLALNEGLDQALAAPQVFTDWNATLRGLDFERGGSLTVRGLDTLTLGSRSASGPFDNAFFSQGGFGSISLSAVGDVTLAAGLDLEPQLLNWRADLPLARPAADGRFVDAAVQPLAALRAPVSLTLAAARAPQRAGDGGYRVAPSTLTLAEGARLATEAGGRLALSASGSLIVAGTLEAPGGDIDLTVTGSRGGVVNGGVPSDLLGYDATQALWLRPSARLLAAGTTEPFVDAQGRATGTLFGGGNVRLNAQRGWLVAEAGSTIDVRGAASPTPLALAADEAPRVVSRPGGSIAIAAPEGMHLASTLRAQAADGNADGGELRLELSLNDLPQATTGPAYPLLNGRQPEREIRLRGPELAARPAFAARPGTDLGTLLTPGLAELSTTTLQAGGFARMTLRTDERIAFDGNQTLSAPQSLTLNAPVVAAAAQPAGQPSSDAEVLLRSPRVSLGDQRRIDPVRTAARYNASTGNAVIEVRAGLVESWGDLVFQGLKSVALNATLDTAGGTGRRDGEVRFIGVARGNAENTATGSLRFGEELQLGAGQVLATTMSEFRIVGLTGATGTSTLGVFGPAGGSASLDPLSAGAALRLEATNVWLDGRIHQPFGSIDVLADRLQVGATASLSVAGSGQTQLLGTTVNGREWRYRPSGLYGGDGDTLKDLNTLADQRLLAAAPAKGLRLDGRVVEIAPQAQLDAAGGGTLLAWEFVPGVGGSRDVLAQAGRFALLPDRRGEFAPYDAEIAASGAAAALRSGTRIEIRLATPLLPAGTYTLLPARYALLPGAVLVSSGIAASARSPLSGALAADDGRWTVDARLSTVGGTAAGLPWQRWTVESQATALTRSRLDRSDTSQLLAANAARLDTLRPALPHDGGRIAVLSGQALRFDARVALGVPNSPAGDDDDDAEAAPQAGELALAQRDGTLAIVDRLGDDRVPAGASQATLASLNASGAGRLILGAVRSAAAAAGSANVNGVNGASDATGLDVLGRSTRLVASGDALRAGEVLLAGRDEVLLAANSGIATPRAGDSSDAGAGTDTAWRLPARSAAVLASARPGVELRRAAAIANDSATGRLTIETGSTVRAQTLRLDASGPMALANTLAPEVLDFGLSAQRLAVGREAGSAVLPADTTVLEGALLDRLRAVPELSFGAVETVDFYGQQSLRAERLRLDAPAVRGLGEAADRVRIEVGTLELRNSSGGTPAAPPAGGSALSARADRIVIGDPGSAGSDRERGRQQLAFGDVSLDSRGEILLAGAGRLETAAPTTLTAQRIGAAAGSAGAAAATDHGVDSGQAPLRIQPQAAAPGAAPLPAPASTGGRIELAGGRIEHRGEIDLPAGNVRLVGRAADLPAMDAVPAVPAGPGTPGTPGRAATPAQPSLLLTAGSRTAARGVSARPGGGGEVAFDAGRIELVAELGSVQIDGRIELDGAPRPNAAQTAPGVQPPPASSTTAADGGTLVVQARSGALDIGTGAALGAHARDGTAIAGQDAVRGGRFEADVARLGAFAFTGAPPPSALDPLADTLLRGGFDQSLALRLRSGDARLEATTLRARQVAIALDSGALEVGGRIEADALSGGEVRLFAGGDLRLGGTISARSTRSGANGGDVQAGSRDGSLHLGAALAIDTRGDSPGDGRLTLRAQRDDDTGRVAMASATGFDAARLQGAEVIVEAVRVHEGATRIAPGSSSGTTLGQATLVQEGEDFVAAHAASELERLALAGLAAASLRPGVEVRSSAATTLTLAADWNLWSADRLAAGWLTLRAEGGLRLDGSLSDGFEIAGRPANASTPNPAQPGAAWSLRLVAGADPAAADPLGTRVGAAADVVVANNRVVRTTAGSIELAAARDVLLNTGSGQQAVVTVVGRPDAAELGGATLQLPNSTFEPQFTAQGGRLAVAAGRDVVGAPTTQTWGNWFYRLGSVDDFVPVSWVSNWDAFRQGLASFGGGDIAVTAGRRVRHLGVASPSSGLAPALDPNVSNPPLGVPQVWNGGDVRVETGEDIAGGTALLGRGEGRLQAGRSIVAEAMPAVGGSAMPTLGPVLGLMDGRWQLRAQRDLSLGSVLDPAVLPSNTEGSQPRIGEGDAEHFFSQGPRSEVDARSTAGTLNWRLASAPGEPLMSQYWQRLATNPALPQAERTVWNASLARFLNVLPPRVQAHAGGDLRLDTAGQLMLPSADALLALSAGGDLRFVGPAAGGFVGWHVSDRDPATLPSVLAPAPAGNGLSNAIANLAVPTDAETVAWGGLAGRQSEPLRLQAGGDLDFRSASSAAVPVSAPMAMQIHAGGDVLDPHVIAQHRSRDDVTQIVAGGNLVQGPGTGSHGVVVAGPGRLEVEAGRQIDLGSSRGIETVGNLYNRALPAQGADVVLAAGQRATLEVDRFVARYLEPQAAGSTDAARAQAEARADAYLAALGRDPNALSDKDRALRGDLVAAHRQQIALLGGGDAAAVRQRRASFVRELRSEQGLAPLADAAAEAAAYDAHLAAFRTLERAAQAAVAERVLRREFAAAYLAPGQPQHKLWSDEATARGLDPAVLPAIDSPLFEDLMRRALFAELRTTGGWGALVPAASPNAREQSYGLGFTALDLAGQGDVFRFGGDLDLVASGVRTTRGGAVTMLAPGGQINVGLPGTGGPPPGGNNPPPRGVVTVGVSGVSALSQGDFQVNSQRVFVVGAGDITVWSSQANVDAGRGANTAISTPPLVAARQADGSIAFELPAVTVGSGIGILPPPTGLFDGAVYLFAPNGEVLALDAQIRAPGRITLGAQVVRGADNVVGGSVAGAAIAVPTASVSVPASAAPTTTTVPTAAAGSAAPRERPRLLLLELLGLGPDGAAPAAEGCEPGESQADCEARRRGVSATR